MTESEDFLTFKRIIFSVKSQDVEKRWSPLNFKYQNMYDLSAILNFLKEEIFDNDYIDLEKHNCYLIVQILDEKINSNFLEKFKQYDCFINSLREKVNELPNFKLLVNTYYNPAGLIDFSLPESNLKEYKYDILSRKEHNYIFIDFNKRGNNYMVISSEEFSDEFFINCFLKNEHNNENLKMITDCNTKKFVIEKIIGPLMRHFNFFKLNFMTAKMESDIHHDDKNVEVEDMINLNKSILNENTCLTFIYTNVRLNKWLVTCQRDGLIMRFIQVLILVKSNLLEKVIREIMISCDNEVLDFLMSYLVDTKIITENEKLRFQKSKSEYALACFVDIYILYLEDIVKQVCSSNIIPFSDDVTNNRKFFMLLYIGFIREYENLNIIQLIRYLDFICYTEMKELQLFVINMKRDIQESGKKDLIALTLENL